jgi:beta-1,2-mannobiose phosphorylase / 1,2-beta-oligomannan phosphorylase
LAIRFFAIGDEIHRAVFGNDFLVSKKQKIKQRRKTMMYNCPKMPPAGLAYKNKTMPKVKNKKRSILSPCAVTVHNRHILFLYSVEDENENKLVFSKSTDGLDFTKGHQFVEIVSEKGKKEKLNNCKDFRLHSFDGTYYLTYTQTYRRFFRKRLRTVIAMSAGLDEFEVIDRMPGNPLESLMVVSNHKHKQNLLAYHGDRSIYVSASDDLISWHTSGKLLSPRKGNFDNNPLKVIDALKTDRGILVLYSSTNNVRGRHELKIGAALFSLNHPYQILWRSDSKIWGKIIDIRDYPIKPVGSIFIKDFLRIYWLTKKKEIFAVNIKLASLGLKKLKESPVQLKKHHNNPIIKPNSGNTWECDATFNPAALNLENKIHLLYRAIGNDGLSVFGYASSNDGFTINERANEPAYVVMKKLKDLENVPSFTRSEYMSGESWAGCEDPRLTKIGSRIYMTYVSFDGCRPPGVALTSIDVCDFINKVWKWRKPILISKPGEIQKNWVLFPEKINGKFAILHSITPSISIEYVDELDKDDFVIESTKRPGKDEYRWDNLVRGAGAPPIKTKYGWLVLYHAMDKRDPNKYKVGAMILDNNDPTKILYRSREPILEPSEDYENNGAKRGVVYVCGTVIKEDTLFVYYGGSDSVVCVATADINEFLEDLVKGKSAQKPATLKKVKRLKRI